MNPFKRTLRTWRRATRAVPAWAVRGAQLLSCALAILLVVTQAGMLRQAAASGTNAIASQGAGVGSRQPAAVTNGLVGWWKLDGNGADESSNANTAQPVSSPTYSDGKFSQAASLNGASQYYTISGMPTGSGSFSMSAWVNLTAYDAGWSSILSWGSGTTSDGTGLSITASGQARFIIWNLDLTSSTIVPLNAWTHLVGTSDGTTKTLYVNGVQVGTSTTALSPSVGTGTIGRRINSSSNYLAGGIDDVRVYNRTLSTAEIAQLYQGSPATACDQSCVGQWKFDDASGSFAVNSATDRAVSRGTLNNFSFNGSTSDWTASGKTGKGLVFDGTDDYVSVPDNPALRPTAVTLSAWVYYTGNLTTFRSIASKWITGNSSSYDLSLTNAGYVISRMAFNSGGGSTLTATSTIPQNQWVHLATTYDGAFHRLYMNGNLEASNARTNVITQTGNPLTIGRNWTDYWQGRIDDVRVYDYGLSQSEITDLVNGTALASDSTSSLVGRFNFEEGSGTATVNSSQETVRPGPARLYNFAGTASSGFTTGQSGNALAFDGSNDYVTVPSSPVNQIATNALTVSAWVKATSLPNSYNYVAGNSVDCCNSTENGFGLRVNNTGTAVFQVTTNGAGIKGVSTPSSTVSTGSWFHLVGTTDGTTMRIYVNGTQSATATNTPVLGYPATRQMMLGILPNASGSSSLYPWSGLIDDVRVYDYAISSSDVTTLYGGGSLANDSTPRLAGWWKFDESSGNYAANSSVVTPGSGALTNFGSSATSGWGSGTFGGGLAFDGTNDYVDAGNEPSVNAIPTSKITVSAWVNNTNPSISGFGTILSNIRDSSNTGYYGYALYINASKQFRFEVKNNSAIPSVVSTTTAVDNQWYLVTGTYDGATLRLYVNGKLEASGAQANALWPIAASYNLMIGRLAFSSTYYWQGFIDDVRVYTRALADYEIADQYNAGR